MDIKSMVNSEDTPAPRKYSASTPVKPEYRPSPPKASTVYENQAPAHDGRRDIRPPQPSPLQTQGQNDFHLRNGSMYNTAQSPYQQTSPPSFRGGHGPPQILNQSPGHGHQTPHYAQRESYPTSGHPNNRPFGHSTPVSQTPTASTPGSASGFANFQRPSSSHSATTPVSAQYSSSVLRESPQPAHHQMRTSSQPQNGQQYMSQPSTPLGPPLTYARSNLHINRGSPGSYDHQRTLSGSSHGQTQVTTPSSAAAKSPQNYRVQHSRSSIPGHTSSQDREGIGDFLYQEVMARTDIGVGPAGGAANLGAIFEIEAKIGQLIDQNTNDRLRLPVLNECVINHASPDLRVKFQSSMTEVQHRNFNQFLNKALVESQPPKPGQPPPPAPRVPMSYKHTYETDTFYDLSQAGILQLPPSLASTIHNDRRSKAKVRITTEQKGGNVIAKIIKARIADIEVYSPKTPFDWRVSVSVEMDYQGDMKQLVEPDRRDGKRADRNKDRMSYKHQGYQIDLTQVTPAEATSKTEKEHELEVEVSSAEVRRQGQLLQSGQRNDYGKLIRSFVDNVRVLARVCPLHFAH
ncbi:polynucleotide 5'-triphosphatase, partial [Lecanoromycetidae sp. Uapishka_2]